MTQPRLRRSLSILLVTIIAGLIQKHAFCRGWKQCFSYGSPMVSEYGKHDGGGSEEPSSGRSSPASATETTSQSEGSSADAAVGLKSHKRSNAVGDPDDDDDGSDDSDDSELASEDYEDWDEMYGASAEQDFDGTETKPDQTPPRQLEVELEIVNDEITRDDGEEDEETGPSGIASSGGVGVRHRFGFPKRVAGNTVSPLTHDRDAEQQLLQQTIRKAWIPHIFLPPPTPAYEYLLESAHQFDAASRARLDRRTLYAGLLLEWTHPSSSNLNHPKPKIPSTFSGRSFLDSEISHSLRATLSLATQPKWRKIFGASSSTAGIRLYQDNTSNEPAKACTLAMQESLCCSLAHSLGAAMVVLDDEIIANVRSNLLAQGLPEEKVKPAFLLQSLLKGVNQQGLPGKVLGASMAADMQNDMDRLLDDPYDDRAIKSVKEMKAWEQCWKIANPEQSQDTNEGEEHTMPLLIFLRVDGSQSLLKSKSVVELLVQECRSQEGTNLLVLGKGVDATTDKVPSSLLEPRKGNDQPNNQPQQWFGFSPSNQNASGQNDPAGSRRFNIFLARTVDEEGNPGILGAVAPPEAGNLFPHMLAMQARERLQNMPNQRDEDNPAREALERWANMLQQQQQQPGQPLHSPQFFNATLSGSVKNIPNMNQQPPPPNVIQETLQRALSEMLSKLTQMSEDEEDSDNDGVPDLPRAFAQVLRNESLRRGIMENLARAAPALSDPKCQGVMLSVYVPPHPDFTESNNNNKPQQQQQPNGINNMNGWFQRILNNQNDENRGSKDNNKDEKSNQRRVRTMAAAAAVAAATSATKSQESEKREGRAIKHLKKLESICRSIVVPMPSDPVRGRSWEAWIDRELGSALFRWNRIALNEQLHKRKLALCKNVGQIRIGSAIRSMLSVRDIASELDAVIRLAIEMEAENSQRRSLAVPANQTNLDSDPSLEQLLLNQQEASTDDSDLLVLHPSTLESALARICKLTPSPYGGRSGSSATIVHRTKEETLALAQDKHEKALVSQVVNAQDIGVTYDMIGGLTEVKELLRQSITYPLKYPHLYSEGIAREAVKGVLLFGPPGTGKTMLAKAVATEGGASFLSVDASSVENKWLGESEKNAKAVFTLARRLSPCVIFIDEVDSLLSSREGSSDDSAHGTLTSVKTTMMSEWDGLNSGTNGKSGDRVIVVGSTNRPFDLDEAVLRRFPRRLLVDLPDLETRKEILEVTLAENRLDPEVNLTKIAERLEGYTGSDIKEVCREAVVNISHEHAKLLDQGHFAGDPNVPQELRPVTSEDFDRALKKLKRSVSETGRELARVWEWNDEYGEIKRNDKKTPKMMSMYL